MDKIYGMYLVNSILAYILPLPLQYTVYRMSLDSGPTVQSWYIHSAVLTMYNYTIFVCFIDIMFTD